MQKNAHLLKNKGHGWCGTSMNDDISEPEFDIQPDSGKILLNYRTCAIITARDLKPLLIINRVLILGSKSLSNTGKTFLGISVL